uniref:Uncharacterized protein n=1 Tax=Oryza glumipatula TaxID=40148 RepID=A0A0D9ZXQ6_9ORYZ
MVSSTMAGVDLPPRRPYPSPPAYKRQPPLPPLSPHTAALSLHSSRSPRRSLLVPPPSQLRPPLAGGRDLVGARSRHHRLRRFLLFPVHPSVKHEDRGYDDADDPKLLAVSPSPPATPSTSRHRRWKGSGQAHVATKWAQVYINALLDNVDHT